MQTRAAAKARPRSRKTSRVIFHSPSPAKSTRSPGGNCHAMPLPFVKKVRASTSRGLASCTQPPSEAKLSGGTTAPRRWRGRPAHRRPHPPAGGRRSRRTRTQPDAGSCDRSSDRPWIAAMRRFPPAAPGASSALHVQPAQIGRARTAGRSAIAIRSAADCVHRRRGSCRPRRLEGPPATSPPHRVVLMPFRAAFSLSVTNTSFRSGVSTTSSRSTTPGSAASRWRTTSRAVQEVLIPAVRLAINLGHDRRDHRRPGRSLDDLQFHRVPARRWPSDRLECAARSRGSASCDSSCPPD